MRKDGMSYRAIGEVTGVDHATVLHSLKSGGELSPPQPTTITGKDGKEYPATKPRKVVK